MFRDTFLFHIIEYLGILFSVLFNVWVWVFIVVVMIDIIILPVTFVISLLFNYNCMFAVSAEILDKVAESLAE